MPYITSLEQKGIHQGAVRVLTRVLTRRFGSLPAWVEERLAQASHDELDRWAERVLEVQRLEEVFES